MARTSFLVNLYLSFNNTDFLKFPWHFAALLPAGPQFLQSVLVEKSDGAERSGCCCSWSYHACMDLVLG